MHAWACVCMHTHTQFFLLNTPTDISLWYLALHATSSIQAVSLRTYFLLPKAEYSTECEMNEWMMLLSLSEHYFPYFIAQTWSSILFALVTFTFTCCSPLVPNSHLNALLVLVGFISIQFSQQPSPVLSPRVSPSHCHLGLHCWCHPQPGHLDFGLSYIPTSVHRDLCKQMGLLTLLGAFCYPLSAVRIMPWSLLRLSPPSPLIIDSQHVV